MSKFDAHSLGMGDIGDEVVFVQTGGNSHDIPDALAKGFKKGEKYKVRNIDIGNWASTYEFEGFEGTFNSVMFEFDYKRQ